MFIQLKLKDYLKKGGVGVRRVTVTSPPWVGTNEATGVQKIIDTNYQETCLRVEMKNTTVVIFTVGI